MSLPPWSWHLLCLLSLTCTSASWSPHRPSAPGAAGSAHTHVGKDMSERMNEKRSLLLLKQRTWTFTNELVGFDDFRLLWTDFLEGVILNFECMHSFAQRKFSGFVRLCFFLKRHLNLSAHTFMGPKASRLLPHFRDMNLIYRKEFTHGGNHRAFGAHTSSCYDP